MEINTMRDYLLTNMWIYDLSGNDISDDDKEALARYNLMYKSFLGEEFYIIGSFDNIISYIQEYFGVEVDNKYLTPLKKIYKEMA